MAKKRTAKTPWYADGLCFECQPDCGACCSNHDDYAYVYLESGEALRLAALLGLDHETFLERYTATDDGHVVLRMDQPTCPFLDGARCGVYSARPLQCRTFPFWEENLATRDSWRRLARFCPGVGQGESHALPVIQDFVQARERETWNES